MGRQRAFILLGGLRVIVRNWLYLTELERRGLKILVITSEGWRWETERMLEQGSQIDAAGFVSGSVEVDGSFTAGVMAKVHEWRTRYDIVGVFAAGEMLVEQTGIVADALGLPSPGLRAARVCRSKYLQRLYLHTWSPQVTIIPPSGRAALDPASLKFPLVLKPSGRRSSSGVHEVRSPDELDLAEYEAEETLLAEEYVTGVEYSVESLVQQGRIIFESLTLKRTNESATDSFVELGHSVPAPPGDGNTSLLAANRAIVEGLAFSDGVVHSELRLTETGRVVLMEIAARTPGDGILPLYHLAVGKPMEPEIVRIALGEEASYPPPRRFARQVYLDHSPGELVDVRLTWRDVEPVWVGKGDLWPDLVPGEAGDPPALRAVLVLKQRGAVLGELRESDDRAVTFLIDAATPDELDELERQVRESIELVLARVGE